MRTTASRLRHDCGGRCLGTFFVWSASYWPAWSFALAIIDSTGWSWVPRAEHD